MAALAGYCPKLAWAEFSNQSRPLCLLVPISRPSEKWTPLTNLSALFQLEKLAGGAFLGPENKVTDVLTDRIIAGQ